MPGTLTKVSIGQWAGGHWAVPPSTAGTGGCGAHHSSVGSEEALPGLQQGPLAAGTGGTFVSGAAGSLAAAQGCPCRWGDLQPSRALLHGRCLRWGFFFSR